MSPQDSTALLLLGLASSLAAFSPVVQAQDFPYYPDWDGDGILDEYDNCPELYNPSQEDTNQNGLGDACDGTPPQQPDVTFGDLLDPVLDYLDCDQGDAALRLLCKAVRAKVDEELSQAGIRIDRGGVLFSYEQYTDIHIDTGHSCSVTARIKHVQARATLGMDASLDLRAQSVSEPLLILVELPVGLDVRFGVKQSFGSRLLFGDCNDYASDSYTASGHLDTNARVAILFALVPTLSADQNGDYMLTIRPMVKVRTDLERTDVRDLHTSGVSPVNGVLTALAGGPSTLSKAFYKLITGDDVEEAFSTRGAIVDLGLPLVMPLLSGPLNGYVLELAESFVRSEAESQVQKLEADLEDALRAQIKRGLRLDDEGKRVFVIRKEYVALIEALGPAADIYLPAPNPPPAPVWTGFGDCLLNNPDCMSLDPTPWEMDPLTWTTAEGALRYELWRNDGATNAMIYSGSTPGFTDPSGCCGPLTYQVRACNHGGCSPFSPVIFWEPPWWGSWW